MTKENFSELTERLDFIGDFPPQSFDDWFEVTPWKSDYTESFYDTYEGIKIEPIYIYENTIDKLKNLPFPSFENYLRGNKASGILLGWNIAQNLYAETPHELNRNLLTDIKLGLNSINIRLKRNSVYKTFDDYFTTEYNSLEDFQTAFENIELEKFPFYVFSSFPDFDFIRNFIDYLNSQNISLNKIKGGIEIDPVNESIAFGKLAKNENIFFEQVNKHYVVVANNLSDFSSINIKANNYLNAGGDRVAELAIALASAVEYLNALNENHNINEIIKRLRFTFSLTPFFFADIAKLRAFKPLWNKVLTEFGVNEDNFHLNILGESSTFYRTIAEPYANMLRATAEAFAGIIANVQSINIIPFDAAFRKPDDFSRRIARNSQLILTEESFLNRVIDSAGGSYFIEELTEEFANKAWKLFTEIEKRGGLLQSAKDRFISTVISESRNKKISDFAKRKLISVGINAYVKPLDKIEEELIGKSKIGNEILDAFDLKIEKENLNFERLSKSFEELRKEVQNAGAQNIELVALGKLSDYKARADFSQALFETGGFNVIYPEKGNQTVEDAVGEILNSENRIFVLCSTDEIYTDFVCDILKQVRSQNKEKLIYLAGKPKEFVQKFLDCGINEFIYKGINVLSFLKSILKIYEERK